MRKEKRLREEIPNKILIVLFIFLSFIPVGFSANFNGSADCGKYVNENSQLVGDIGACPVNGLIINSSNIELNCSNYKITSLTGLDEGIYNPQYTNVTIKNCEIVNFTTGIYFISDADGNISNPVASFKDPHEIACPFLGRQFI